MDNLIDLENNDKMCTINNQEQLQCVDGNKDEVESTSILEGQIKLSAIKNSDFDLNTMKNYDNKIIMAPKGYGFTQKGFTENKTNKSLLEPSEITVCENELKLQSHLEDQLHLKLSAENKHMNELVSSQANCVQTCQENSNCKQPVDKLNNVDGNFNLEDFNSKKDKMLNKEWNGCADNSSTDKDHWLPLTDYYNLESSMPTRFSHQEAAKSTVQYQLFEKFHINPSPNEFDVLKESDLSNTFLLNKNHSDNLGMSHSDNFVVISNNNAVPQAENIVSSNYSLSQLQAYESDDSLNGEFPLSTQQYREVKNKIEGSDKDSDSDSSSTSSSTSILISDSSDSESESDDEYENNHKRIRKPIKAKGELDLDDLPPIKDLKISVREEDCTPVGKVFQIVDQLVVIQALTDLPAYDLDTVLFIQGDQPLGRIFDVFGPVTEPYYCVRFNSRDHIKEKNIQLNQMVYCAPKTKHTKYVFLAQLMKLKGSDASWEDDYEPPAMYLDYSDDEQEKRAKMKKHRNRKGVFKVDSDPDEPARKRHFVYEKKMNERNLQLSADRSHQNRSKRTHSVNNVLWASSLPPVGSLTTNTTPRSPHIQDVNHQMFGRPPVFNISVPPPNTPFSLPLRPSMCNVLSREHTQSNRNQTEPPSPTSHNSSSHFLQPSPPYGPAIPPRSSNNSRGPPHPYMPAPLRFFGNREPNKTIPSWMQSLSRYESSWTSSPPPSMENPVVNNHILRTSPFFIQGPGSSRPNVPTSILPNRPFSPYSSMESWPVQTPPRVNNAHPHNSPDVHFNPHIPPPSPNPFNY